MLAMQVEVVACLKAVTTFVVISLHCPWCSTEKEGDA